MKVPQQQAPAAAKSNARQPFLQRKPASAGAAERPFISRKACTDIQPKLTVNRPGDAYEQEADRMAEQVMRMPVSTEAPPMISRMYTDTPVQRKCSACAAEKEEDASEEMVQRQAVSSDPTHASDAVTQRLIQRKGRGDALPPAVHEQMGQAFQSDFSDVRLHTDAEAAQMSDDLNAQAFTHGDDIYFNKGRYQPETVAGRGLLGHELTHTVQQQGQNPAIQRKDASNSATPERALRAETLIAARFPYLLSVLDASQVKKVQHYLDYRTKKQRAEENLKTFEVQNSGNKVSLRHNQVMYLDGYDKKRAALSARIPKKPDETSMQVDTAKLLDRAILDEQTWNAAAEREFRERWVLNLVSKPTTFNFEDWLPIELCFDGPYWGEEKDTLPNQGGLITFDSLLYIKGASYDYHNEVLNSPLIQTVRSMHDETRFLFNNAEEEYDFEVERRAEHPVVRRIAEFLGSSNGINEEELRAFIAVNRNVDKNDPSFHLGLYMAMMKQPALPSKAAWDKIKQHYNSAKGAYQKGWYEAVVMVLPTLAEEIADILLRTYRYSGLIMSGAGRIVQALEIVKAGSKIALTIGGGVAGKGLGLLGVSLGSGAGAGFSTLTQEVAAGNTDVGSIIKKTGKDAMLTSISTLIGGALAGKFQALFNARLAAQIPDAVIRTFWANRVADVASGVLTTPIEITINGMLEGKWPKNMDEFLDQVAQNTLQSVVIGGAVDAADGGFWRLNAPNTVGKPVTVTDPPGHVAGQADAGIPVSSDPAIAPTSKPKQATSGDPMLDQEIDKAFALLVSNAPRDGGKGKSRLKFDPKKDPYAGPGVRIPVSKAGNPARVLDVGAGATPTDLGLPPESSLIAIERSDIHAGAHIDHVFDATKTPPPELFGKIDAVIINNPYGYTPNLEELALVLKPNGRIIVQGHRSNKYFKNLIKTTDPPGIKRITMPDEGALPPASTNTSSDIMGGPFSQSKGNEPAWPNERIIFEWIGGRSSDPGHKLVSPHIVSETAEITAIDRKSPLSASGFPGSTAAHKGYGAFDARIRIADGSEVEAVVKILPKGKGFAEVFIREAQGAKAAAATGLGPKFYGIIPVEDGYAFAMSKVPGTFTENFATPGSPQFAKAEAETQAAIVALIPETPQDVRRYGNELLKLGFYTKGDLQGLIGPDGRWKAIDFSSVERIPTDPIDRLSALRDHNSTIEMEANLYERILAEKQAAGGIAPTIPDPQTPPSP